MNRYPKLIQPQNFQSDFIESSDAILEKDRLKRSPNKEFLYFVAFTASIALFVFIVTIGNLSEEAASQISDMLGALPFLDLKISTQLIKDLHFPNPVTSSILLGNAAFLSFALLDIFKKEEINKDGTKDLFKESSSVSYVIHIVVLLLILSSLLFNLHPKPKIQITRIEFIPSQPESRVKPPQDTKRKAEKNSIDQGKHDPKKPVKAPDKPANKATLPPKPVAKTNTQSKLEPKPKTSPEPKKQDSPMALPSLPLPIPRNIVPQPKVAKEGLNPIKQSSLQPVALPKLMDYTPNSNAASGQGSTGTPSPKASSGVAGAQGSSEVVARLTSIPRAPDALGGSGQGGGGGADGNPGANNYPDRAPGVAAQADVNFGPYMSALQRKIKRMWKPPRGTESSRIVVTFSIAADGRLTNLKLTQGSSFPDANMAALDAVSKAAAFDPLPPGSGSNVDIEFTFDYNVFQRTRW